MTSIEKELNNMDERLTEMENKIDSIDRKVTQVVDAILGNPLTKQGGLLKDYETQKEEIAILKSELSTLRDELNVEKDFRKKIYWLIGLFVGFLALVQYIANLYSTIKK